MTDKDFIKFVETFTSMTKAAIALGLSFSTFKRKATKLECYKPNQGSKGTIKQWVSDRAIPLQEIFDGLHPKIGSYKLKNKLYKHGLKSNKCKICGISEWNQNKISCELHHKDGNKYNHSLDNLQILCPNCHSQTDNFRYKRGRGETGKHKTLKRSTAVGSSPTAHTKL